MHIVIDQVKESDEGNISFLNGQNLTLRYESDYSVDSYSLSAIPSINGRYETTTSITASGNYKLFKNGIEDKSWGGSNGKYLISETNFLDVNNFNVGETLVVENVGGEKRFVPTSLTGAVGESVISSISASLVALQPNVWLIFANIIDAGGDSVDLDTTTYKYGRAGINIKVQQLDRSDINPGSYLIYTQPNAPIFNSKTVITFLEIDDEVSGGDIASYSYKTSYPFLPYSTTDIGFRIFDSTGTIPCNPTKQILIKIEVYS